MPGVPHTTEFSYEAKLLLVSMDGKTRLRRSAFSVSLLVLLFVMLRSVIRTPLYARILYKLSLGPHPNRDNVVWVVSHRRSGTHLTMDLLATILPRPFIIVKTNHVILSNPSSGATDALSCACLHRMRRQGKLVHAVRDVRDVVISTYFYMKTFSSAVRGSNVTLDGFLDNELGLRDKVIESWVKTTSPWFNEPDVFHQRYTESVSTLPHTFDALANFLGKKANAFPKETDSLKSYSQAVHKGAGLGEHGFLSAMSKNVSDEILRLARKIELEWRQKWGGPCPRSGAYTENEKQGRTGFFWVGRKKKYDLPLPANICPTSLEFSRVVSKKK